jgi:hypothetical protein
VEGVPATFTFTFSGHYHGTNGAGRGIAAGTMREDLSFTKSGVSRSCTSGPLTWSATRKSG